MQNIAYLGTRLDIADLHYPFAIYLEHGERYRVAQGLLDHCLVLTEAIRVFLWPASAYTVTDAYIYEIPDVFSAYIDDHAPDGWQGNLLGIREEHVPTDQLSHLFDCYT